MIAGMMKLDSSRSSTTLHGMRAAFAADLELVKLLLDYKADPSIISKDGETMVSAAAGLAFIHGYHRGKSPEERLQVVKRFVELGNEDVVRHVIVQRIVEAYRAHAENGDGAGE